MTQRLIASGADEVIGHAPLPSESRLNNTFGECHVVSTAKIDTVDVVLYGVDGRVIRDDDPGDATLLDLEWDLNQQKDQDVGAGAFSMDPGSSESSPMFEPGEPQLDSILGMALEPKNQFFKRRKMVSFISTPRGFVSGTPDQWWPGDVFKLNTRKRIEVDVMSTAVVVFSAPSLDDTTTTAATSFSSEAKWMQMKYFEVVLEQAWMELMGLTEAGAESPWEEAALLVEEVLEPTVIEETAGGFNNAAFHAFCGMTWDITVPGRREFNTISVS